MRIELAERLRCPSPHAPTPLILVSQLAVERELITGILGCPVCRLEARITDGDLHFAPVAVTAAPVAAVAGDATAGVGGDATAGVAGDATAGVARGDLVPDLDRVIALLGLSEPGGAVLLTGRYATLAARLSALAEVSVVVMLPTQRGPTPGAEGAGVSALHGLLERLPFTDGTFRGVALSASTPPSMVSEAVRTTSLGGRVLADVDVTPTQGLKELARDDQEWVAAREQLTSVVELKRRQ